MRLIKDWLGRPKTGILLMAGVVVSVVVAFVFDAQLWNVMLLFVLFLASCGHAILRRRQMQKPNSDWLLNALEHDELLTIKDKQDVVLMFWRINFFGYVGFGVVFALVASALGIANPAFYIFAVFSLGCMIGAAWQLTPRVRRRFLKQWSSIGRNKQT